MSHYEKHKSLYNAEERTPTNSIIQVNTPHKPLPFIESTSQKIKQKIKNAVFEIPERMKPTSRTMTLTISLCVTGSIVALMYVFARDLIAIYYPAAFLWIATATIFAYYEIDFTAFKICISTFRGLIICIAVFISILCDFARHFLTNDDGELFFTILLGNIAWIYGIVYMIFLTDSAPTILNFIRFLGPLVVLLQTLWYIIDHFFWTPDDNFTLFTFYKGSLTLNDVQSWCKLQILWYGCSFVLSVPCDPKHKYFVLRDDRVLTKMFLPFRNISTETTTFCFRKFTIKTVYMFHIITAVASMYAALCLFVLLYNDDDIPSNEGIIIAICLCMFLAIMLYTMSNILLIKYFQLFMVKKLLMQFRANTLIATIVILIYVALQKIIWQDDNDIIFILSAVFNYSVFILGVFALWIRDGMHILFPTYFIFYFGVLLLLVSVWNIFMLTFAESGTRYPAWFILLEKQAYFQVILIWFLCFFYWLRDRNSHYFVLIRQRRETQTVWHDPPDKYQSLSEYDIDVSSYFVNRSRQLSQIENLNSVIIDGSDGNDNL